MNTNTPVNDIRPCPHCGTRMFFYFPAKGWACPDCFWQGDEAKYDRDYARRYKPKTTGVTEMLFRAE